MCPPFCLLFCLASCSPAPAIFCVALHSLCCLVLPRINKSLVLSSSVVVPLSSFQFETPMEHAGINIFLCVLENICVFLWGIYLGMKLLDHENAYIRLQQFSSKVLLGFAIYLCKLRHICKYCGKLVCVLCITMGLFVSQFQLKPQRPRTKPQVASTLHYHVRMVQNSKGGWHRVPCLLAQCPHEISWGGNERVQVRVE